MNRLTQQIVSEAKFLRAQGESWKGIANKTGATVKQLRYHADKHDWNYKGLATIGQKDIAKDSKHSAKPELIAEIVERLLTEDIETSAQVLVTTDASQLSLRDWQKREQIAESIQKRAASLLNIGQKAESVVNIAVLSSLPDPQVQQVQQVSEG